MNKRDKEKLDKINKLVPDAEAWLKDRGLLREIFKTDDQSCMTKQQFFTTMHPKEKLEYREEEYYYSLKDLYKARIALLKKEAGINIQRLRKMFAEEDYIVSENPEFKVTDAKSRHKFIGEWNSEIRFFNLYEDAVWNYTHYLIRFKSGKYLRAMEKCLEASGMDASQMLEYIKENKDVLIERKEPEGSDREKEIYHAAFNYNLISQEADETEDILHRFVDLFLDIPGDSFVWCDLNCMFNEAWNILTTNRYGCGCTLQPDNFITDKEQKRQLAILSNLEQTKPSIEALDEKKESNADG